MSLLPCTRLWVSLFAAACCCQAGAQTRIFSCVDAKGHRLTSDRPIMECLDREQKEYGPNGMARGKLPPSPTAEERAAQDEKARQDELARQHQAELKRRDRVLLNRYPDLASHDRERAASLAQVDEAIASGETRVAELQKQRADLELQAKAGTKDATKAARLKRAMDEDAEALSVQNRLLAAQREERQRITVRFDEERKRLQALWAQMPVAAQARQVPVAATTAAATAATTPKPTVPSEAARTR